MTWVEWVHQCVLPDPSTGDEAGVPETCGERYRRTKRGRPGAGSKWSCDECSQMWLLASTTQGPFWKKANAPAPELPDGWAD